MPHVAPISKPTSPPAPIADVFEYARRVLREEGEACLDLSERLGEQSNAGLREAFRLAVELLAKAPTSVIVSGMGKAGLIAQKVSATLASLGVASFYLHPAEAVHGDLGRVRRGDVLLILSASGETEEIVRLLPVLSEIGAPIVAITANPAGSLARAALVTLDLGVSREACSLGLAPSTSTTAMLALGDALALVAARLRGFTAGDFAKLHPAGNLGRRLAKVEDAMRPLAECRVGREDGSVREVLISLGRPGRRTGAVMVTDMAGRLTGLFTDSDLARLLERKQDAALERPLREVMTVSPTTVRAGQRMDEAVRLLAHRKISELPVVDAAGAPLGLIDVTDVVAWLPQTRRVSEGMEARRVSEGAQPTRGVSQDSSPSFAVAAAPSTTQFEQSPPLSPTASAPPAPSRRRARLAARNEADRAVTLPFPGANGAPGAASSSPNDPANKADQQFHRLE